MKNLYTIPELKITVFGAENVAAAASNPNAQKLIDEWEDFDSITAVRFADLKYVE